MVLVPVLIYPRSKQYSLLLVVVGSFVRLFVCLFVGWLVALAVAVGGCCCCCSFLFVVLAGCCCCCYCLFFLLVLLMMLFLSLLL